jgi:ABC-type sugar transport system ATPase subunit
MLLEMHRIHKSFSGVEVLTDVSFDLEPGEVHILAGENGAGKSTLIKILAGVHTDYRGVIRLEGRPVRFHSPIHAARHGISAIHQDLSLINAMSIEDNIFLGRENVRSGFWMDHRSQQQRARELLKQLRLEVDIARPIGEFPLPIRQMIEIAKALVFEARILVMDEPTSALNDQEVDRLFELIERLKHQGCSIIYISHRMEVLIHWMVGREITRQFPDRHHSPAPAHFRVHRVSLKSPTKPDQWAVRDVSFTIHRGEILGIAGLQGSGKSELLNGLFGTYGRLPQGAVELDGRSLEIRSPSASIREGMILLTNDRQGTGLVPAMNVVQNISLASLDSLSRRGWLRKAEEYDNARALIKALGIRFHSPEQETMTLSGGNQQKVVLAKCISTKPRILLLDEPTMGVDVGAKHDIYTLMNQWTERGIAILLVTSELPELLAMSDRILVMHRGRCAAVFDREEATQAGIIHAAMGEQEN